MSSIHSGAENQVPLKNSIQPAASPSTSTSWKRGSLQGAISNMATEKRNSSTPALGKRAITVSQRASLNITAAKTPESPSILRKLLHRAGGAARENVYAHDAIAALRKADGNYNNFNKHADLLKEQPGWEKAVERQVANLTIHERMQCAALGELNLRGFDKEVAQKILSCMKLSNQAKLVKSLTPNVITSTEKTVLGGGAVNTVYKVTHIKNRREITEVFKPDPAGMGALKRFKEKLFGTAVASGIPAGDDAHLSARAVASSEIDRLLFPDRPISVHTRFATVDGQRGILMENAAGESPRVVMQDTQEFKIRDLPQILQKKITDTKFVAAMLKASDIQIKDDILIATKSILNIDVNNPRTAEGLVMLQCLDIITGQVDRHPGNYHVQSDGGVKGIDQDCSFGVNALPENVDVRSQPPLKGFIPNNSSLMLRMPPVITTYIQTSINNLHANKERLRATLSPYITPAEIEATISRLDKLQAHISNCFVADTEESLIEPFAQNLLNPDNSYLSREIMILKQEQKGWNNLRERFIEEAK